MPKRSQFDAVREAVLATRKVKTGGLIDKKIEKGAFLIVGLLCALLLAMIFLPHHNQIEKSKGIFHKETVSDGLNQNLEMLEMFKDLKKSENSQGKQFNEPTVLEVTEKGNKKQPLTKALQLRMNSPMTIYAFQGESKVSSSSQKSNTGMSLFRSGSDNAFLNSKSDISEVKATKFTHPEFTIVSGEMIPATLETAINSELPGMVKAIVSRDVYSYTGDRLLIPKGSQVIGQFSAELKSSQSRALVIWERLFLPDGITVSMNAPSTDRLGDAGVQASHINHHFLERLSASSLLSVLGLYSEASNDLSMTASSYPSLLKQRLYQEFSQDLARHVDIKPTLTIQQGESIHIFVTQNIDFYGVLHESA